MAEMFAEQMDGIFNLGARMNWGIAIGLGSVTIAALAFMVPVVRRSGKTEQRVSDLANDVDNAFSSIRRINDDVTDIKVMLGRVEENTKNIKESIRGLK
ncbi:MAG: hypothetical protein PVG39_01440 [Desulfobacteraceae bacterium]|jgi:hypothetical protein